MDSKVAKKRKRQPQFKDQQHIYNIQSNSNVYHRGMKMRCNSKQFPSLIVINGKTLPYASKGIPRHYHYLSDPKLSTELLPLEEFHVVAMIAQIYYLFLRF